MNYADKAIVVLVIYSIAATFGWGYYKGRNAR